MSRMLSPTWARTLWSRLVSRCAESPRLPSPPSAVRASRPRSRPLTVEPLEDRLAPSVTINLLNNTGLDPTQYGLWVEGSVGAGGSTLYVLQANGTFGPAAAGLTNLPIYQVSNLPAITLSGAISGVGGGRVNFYVSPLSQPPTGSGVNGTHITNPPTPPFVPGQTNYTPPFDFFEFTYLSGGSSTIDLSGVNGFGMPITVNTPTLSPLTPGVNASMTIGVTQSASFNRAAIGAAYTQFTNTDALGANFGRLLYNAAVGTIFEAPPLVDGQFYSILDPADWLANQPTTAATDPFASYWDNTLNNFFAVGNHLSISVNADGSGIYSGTSSLQTNPLTGVQSPAYTLTGPQGSFTFFQPLPSTGAANPGLTGALYVFQQQFNNLTPAGSGGDAGLLQDNIWQALCRGVALDGVSATPITNGETSTAWNANSNGTTNGIQHFQWYVQHTSNGINNAFPGGVQGVYHTFAKFMHYGALDGTDSRVSGSPPIFINNQAYGFSEDENPDGPYTGNEVPAKFDQNIPDGTTLTLTVDPWGAGIPAGLLPPPTTNPGQIYAVGTGQGSPAFVKVFDVSTNEVRFFFAPYADAYPGFTGGVRVAVGDVNGDGFADLITGLGPGGPPRVRVFDGRTGQQLYDFFAFEASYTGGIYVAAGDVNSFETGRVRAEDILVGRGEGLPEIKVFGGGNLNLAQLYWFYAFDTSYLGGVTVAMGDLNGDGYADMIMGTPTGASRIRVYGGGTLSGVLIQDYFAFANHPNGVNVGAGDVNNDGRADVLVGSNAGAPQIMIFDGRNTELLQNFFAFGATGGGGVRVSSLLRNQDGRPDLLAGRGPGQLPEIQILDFGNLEILDFVFAFDPPAAFPGGVFVGG